MKLICCNTGDYPNLVKVLELLSHYNHPHESDLKVYRAYAKYQSKKRVHVSRDYSTVAKKCIISHRFAAAATMLDIICQEFTMDNVFFYKAALVVLENFTSITNEEFLQFLRYVIGLMHVNKREIVLEYLIYNLKNCNVDGKYYTQSLISNQRKNVIKNVIIDPLLKAYLGMHDYIEWAKSREGGIQDLLAKTSAEKAIIVFQEVIEVPGQWDIFIFKLVEMLAFYNNHEQIGQLLKKYVEVNPEHINGHIYLCWFLNKYQPSSAELKNSLKSLVKLCPSDSRVLLLVTLLKDTQPEKSLKMLFMFLDYPSNSKNSEAWNMLLDMLVCILECERPSLIETMNACWRHRQDIWPYIHFNAKKIATFDKEVAKLAVMKGAVLSVFIKTHPYLHFILENLPETSSKLFKKFINKVSYIEYLKESSCNEASDCSDADIDMDVT